MQNPAEHWRELLSVWRSGQVGLPAAQRWKKYDKSDEHGGIRRQDSLQHSYSIVLLGRILVHYLRREGVRCDSELLLTALLLHDHGEGELGQDTVYVDKTDSQDLNEYLAFRKRFEALPADLYAELERAFLLQFAAKAPEIFPEEAHRVMAELRAQHALEILVFDAVERWDYLLFPLEQMQERGNTRILVQVLRNNLVHLNRLADALPAFASIVWTPGIRDWCMNFLAHYEGQWIEQKGER